MKIEVYKDASGDWRWRKRADNGKIVSESGEGYERPSGAEIAAHDFAGEGEVVFVSETQEADEDSAA